MRSGVGNLHSPYQINNLEKVLKETEDHPVWLKFIFNTLDHGRIALDSILWSGNLYLGAKANLIQKISKEEFVNLLELAEEDLNCDHVILCIPKKEPDRNLIVRTFMYFGFTLLAPNNQLIPADANSDDLYMATSFN